MWAIILSIIVRCAKLHAFARRADNKLRLLVQKLNSHPSHFVTKDKFRLVRWCNRGRKLPFHSKHFLKPFGNPKCMTNNEHSESFVTRLQSKVWLLGVKHKIEGSAIFGHIDGSNSCHFGEMVKVYTNGAFK